MGRINDLSDVSIDGVAGGVGWGVGLTTITVGNVCRGVEAADVKVELIFEDGLSGGAIISTFKECGGSLRSGMTLLSGVNCRRGFTKTIF